MTEDNRQHPAQPVHHADSASKTAAKPGGALPPEEEAENGAETPVVPVTRPPGSLDIGAFTQLLTAAQQCGLVANADAINRVLQERFSSETFAREG